MRVVVNNRGEQRNKPSFSIFCDSHTRTQTHRDLSLEKTEGKTTLLVQRYFPTIKDPELQFTTGMVGAYAYSQVDEPTSTAGAAARSFKAAVTGVCAPPVTNPLRAHLLPFAARSTCGSREGRGAKVESQRGACTAVALPPLRGHF